MKRTQTVLSAHTQPSRHKEEDNNTHPPCVKNVAMKEKDGYRKKASSRSGNCKDNAKASKSNGESSVLSNTTALMSSHVKSLDGGREPDIANGLVAFTSTYVSLPGSVVSIFFRCITSSLVRN